MQFSNHHSHTNRTLDSLKIFDRQTNYTESRYFRWSGTPKILVCTKGTPNPADGPSRFLSLPTHMHLVVDTITGHALLHEPTDRQKSLIRGPHTILRLATHPTAHPHVHKIIIINIYLLCKTACIALLLYTLC